MERKAFFGMFVAVQGAGKTTRMKSFLPVNQRNLIFPANRYDDAWQGIPSLDYRVVEVEDKWRPGKKTVQVEIPELNTFTGNRTLYIEDNRVLKAVFEPETGYTNGGLFMDDFKDYIPSQGLLPGYVRRFFSGRRHRMVDIFAATHSWQAVNVEMFEFSPACFMFQVDRPITDSIENKVKNFEAMKSSQKITSYIAQKYDKHYCQLFQPATSIAI